MLLQNFNLLDVLFTLPGILIGLTFHEYAHAYMATKFGDPTPKRQGRLTVNPLAHIDIFGFIFLVLVGFGWGKPVQTNPSYYRGNVRKKDIFVSLAGPAMNLIVAFFLALIYALLLSSHVLNGLNLTSVNIIDSMFNAAIGINCVLFVFNLIPIPPLDGFHIVVDFLPQSAYQAVYTLERYGMIILAIFMIMPFFRTIIVGAANYIFENIINLINLIFRIF